MEDIVARDARALRFSGSSRQSDSGYFPLRFVHPEKIRSSATVPVTDFVH